MIALCVNQIDEVKYNLQTIESLLKPLVCKGSKIVFLIKNFQWYPLCYVGVTWLILTDKFCVSGLCESGGPG